MDKFLLEKKPFQIIPNPPSACIFCHSISLNSALKRPHKIFNQPLRFVLTRIRPHFGILTWAAVKTEGGFDRPTLIHNTGDDWLDG